MPSTIVAVLTDLMFTVKISDAAKRAGVAVQFVKTDDDALMRADGATAVILDLNYATPELIARLKSEENTRRVPLVGYVSHVAVDVIQRARGAGCDTIMARSAFVEKLPEMMQHFAAAA